MIYENQEHNSKFIVVDPSRTHRNAHPTDRKQSAPTRVSLLMGTEPVFGALFAVYWLDESLSVAGWFGGFLMVAASLWAVRPKKAD